MTFRVESKLLNIRPYQQRDRNRVRELCVATGYLGQPVDSIFEDTELFADFLTAYYTDCEPESAFVVESEGLVVGYLLGARHSEKHKRFYLSRAPVWLLKVLGRFLFYRPSTRRYFYWLLFRGRSETPAVPKGLAHFHINLLPEARCLETSRQLVDVFLKYLHEAGEKGVYGQMVTVGGRRTDRVFERFGFQVLNRQEVTKFRGIHPEPVFLCTVQKEFTTGTRLYARSQADL
ncbi:MAG: GNAT family acetyltransferase [Verrucomicrobiales bacterium]